MGSPVIKACTFESNREASVLSGHATLIGCTFRDNGSAASETGAIWAPAFELVAVDCLFAGNRSARGGGVRAGVQCDLYLENCVILDNSARMGGAIYAEGGVSIRNWLMARK